MKIHAGAGYSTIREDAFAAGQEAAQKALESLHGQSPDLIIIYSTPVYDLSQLLKGIRSQTGETPLIGSTSAGQIIDGEHLGFGRGVTVLALTSGPYQFGIASVEKIKGKLNETGRELARKSKSQITHSKHAAILLLVDCLAGDLQEVILGVYHVTGPNVTISGGAASDELKFKETTVFHNDKVLPGGAVALWISSDKPIKIITKHGFEPIGIPMLVTKAEGTVISELGGRPAAIAYEEQLGLAPGELSKDDFWATSIRHPLGLLQPDGKNIIRVARSKSDEGSLHIQGCVPPTGSAVQVMTCTNDSLLNVADEVGEEFIKDEDLSVLLVFSCAARAVMYGDRTHEESQRIKNSAGDKMVFGQYCCGEFARTAGVLGTHNATLTALAL